MGHWWPGLVAGDADRPGGRAHRIERPSQDHDVAGRVLGRPCQVHAALAARAGHELEVGQPTVADPAYRRHPLHVGPRLMGKLLALSMLGAILLAGCASEEPAPGPAV